MLVVTSKVKKYIKEKGGMCTSSVTIEALSKAVECICDGAIAEAKEDKRKTVMDRDVRVVMDEVTAK